jgi:hypothetical protein
LHEVHQAAAAVTLLLNSYTTLANTMTFFTPAMCATLNQAGSSFEPSCLLSIALGQQLPDKSRKL